MRGLAIILRTETFIAPFGDHVSASFFAGQTLAETQDDALSAVGFAVHRAAGPAEAHALAAAHPASPVLLMLDRVFVSRKVVRDFLRAARKTAGSAALTLSVNASVQYTLPLQDVIREGDQVVHDVILTRAAELPPPEGDSARWIRALTQRAARVVVPKRELVTQIPLPTMGEGERRTMAYPVTSTVVVSIEHWVHVLWLNQIAFGIRWMDLIRRHPLWTAFRALSALSVNRDRLLSRLIRRGARTRIHPTAYVSASILGDDVEIGAHASVQNSIVGSGSIIQDHAALLNSVVGPRNLVQERTFMISSASYPEATISNYKLQVALIGRGAYVNVWAGFVDARFQGDVMVAHKGQLVSTGRNFLACCVGHRARVAAKVLIQPGREIPNDTLVVMRPDEVVSFLPPDLPAGTPLVRDGGTLVKLGSERQSG